MTRLFAGGFPRDLEEAELQEIFEQYGAVLAVKIVRDKHTNISRRFGFVDMDTKEGADLAMGELHGGSIDGDEISVKYAEDRTVEKKPKLVSFRKAPSRNGVKGSRPRTGGYQKVGNQGPPQREKRPRFKR